MAARGDSPLDADAFAVVGLGISSSSGPARRPSSSSSSRRNPTPGDVGGSTSATKTSPPHAKKRSKDEKPPGKDMRKSCAECRRLKAKCDRVFPCSNCRRRGCALVCPDGDLGCMQGKRLVLASTEQLHDRVSPAEVHLRCLRWWRVEAIANNLLMWQIAQLETALFQSHGKISGAPHPLLAPEFLDGGFASQPPPAASRQVSDPLGAAGDKLEGLALSEELARGSDVDYVSSAITGAFLPADFRPDAAPRAAIMTHLRRVLNTLPSRDEARLIADRFFLEAEWFNYTIRREEYDGLYEPSVYAPNEQNPLSLHKLACVLMVLALQHYLDPSRDFDAVDGKVALYWDAAQQCFDTRCGWTATVPGVQALALMTWFVHFTSQGGGDTGPGTSSLHWLRRMTAACQELQLHREPYPSVSQHDANFHRRVFWEATAIDAVVSPTHSHHTGIPIEQIEVRYPTDVPQWAIMRYEFTRMVSYQAIDLGLRSDSNPASSQEIRGLEQLLADYLPEAQPAMHCPYLVGEPLPDLSSDTSFDVSAIQRSSASMTLYECYLCVYRASLRRIIDRIRSNPDTELSSWDRHIVQRAFETSQNIIRLVRYVHRTTPRIAGRDSALWTKLFVATATIAASAIWCGPHMTPSFVGQVVVELNDITGLATEATSFNPSSDRPLAVRQIVPLFQSMIIGRYPQLVGDDPTRVTASIAREDMLYALLGGIVDGVSGLRSAFDWSSAMASAPGVPASAPTSWAPIITPHMLDSPRRDISPAQLHTPSHEGVPGTVSPFPGTASPLAFGGQGYFDNATGVPPHHMSPPHGSGSSDLAQGFMPQQFAFADMPRVEPPPPPPPPQQHLEQGDVPSQLWNHLQTMYTPNPWWGLGEDRATVGTQYSASSVSTPSAPASLSASMSMAMSGDSCPTSAPYHTARMPSLSPVPPPVPRVMSVPGVPPQPMASPMPQAYEHESMPPPPMFPSHPESR